MWIGACRERDETDILRHFAMRTAGSIYIPISGGLDQRLMGRLIGKIGLEEIARRTLTVDGSNDEIVGNPQLDPLRSYVRRNEGATWPLSQRRIYDEDNVLPDGDQIVHEYTILVTGEIEFYSVVCIFGMEYALNLGGPDLGGYERWLAANGHKSPLY